MKQTIVGTVLGLSVAMLLGTAWNGSYESSPAGTDLASDLDTFIQGFKTEVRQRAEVEHLWGGSTDDNGLHAMGSARCFVQNTAPTAINSGTAALGQYNSAASSDGGTTLTTDEVGSVTRDIGAGRCWIDLDGLDGVVGSSDDNQLNVWNETSNTFVAATATPATGGSGVAVNLIYNGSFEITDGTGSTASTTIPAGWTVINTPAFTYTDPTGVSEGEGIAVSILVDAVNEGMSQSLSGLKASTAYVFRARVNPLNGTCDLQVTGGAATVTDTSEDSAGVYETLEVTATTTAGPAALVVRLETNAGADNCRWDHVTAFEKTAVVAQPGIQVCYDTDASDTADAYTTAGTWADALVSCAITIPGPGYIVEVRGQIAADNETGNVTNLAGRIRENGVTVGLATALAQADADAANAFRDVAVVPLFTTRTGLTPGTTYTYTLEATPDNLGGNPSWDRNIGASDGADDLNDSANLKTVIEVKLVPVR